MSGSSRPRVVTLFGRADCHLCDEAREGLLDLQARGAEFELREVDIEANDGLHRRLVELIPVVEVEGERVCELFLDPDAVLARLDTLSR